MLGILLVFENFLLTITLVDSRQVNPIANQPKLSYGADQVWLTPIHGFRAIIKSIRYLA